MTSWDNLFIGTAWQSPAGTDRIHVSSPSSEDIVGSVPHASEEDINRSVAVAQSALADGRWSRRSPEERAQVLEKVADLLGEQDEELAQLIVAEMGAPYSYAKTAQVFGPVITLRSNATWAREFPFETRMADGTNESLIISEPVGVVAAIVPWNVPLTLAMTKVAPALAAGCSVILKPAPETPLSTNVMAEAFAKAGLPPGVLSIVPAGREISEYLVCHPGVDKVGFTGSTTAGRRIASLCGERLKRVSLELGGKSAAIMLADADVEHSIKALIPMVFRNNGQACVAQTRLLVPRSGAAAAVDVLVEAVRGLTVGDPYDPETDIGPLITSAQRDRVEGYIEDGQREGAWIAIGGKRPAGLDRGWYVSPTVLTNVNNRMRVAREEIFGPVICVIEYDDLGQAVAIANDSDYGLSGSVWTRDNAAGLEVARRVQTGNFLINGVPQAFGAPFGGFKNSGIGRENGHEGIRSYVEAKSVSVPTAKNSAPS